MQPSGQLNEAQQRRLSITCQHIDKLLQEIENVLHERTSKSPFPRHIPDVTPAQGRVLEDHIRRVREQLLRALAWQNLHPDSPNIPATRSILSHLAFIDIDIEELKPSYMRGSGAVAEGAADELNGVVHELRSVVQSMERYIHQEFGADLESRLKKLEMAGNDVALLRTIEEIVTRHGMVEFRPRIASLASRLEDNNLEVAVFGRVNSGKSSLLNAVLHINVLPVGVNPITAVPTRLCYGAELRPTVAFASGREENVSLDEFRSLITEDGNPGNERNVVRALVEVPSSQLLQGIVLVDTPGLGSLARHGAAETMAYLPSCDVALLLIDSAAALNDEDVGTLRLLYEAGIPALVLLSKADLLGKEDRDRVSRYIAKQVQSELNLQLAVYQVSAIPQCAFLLDRFFEQEMLPRFEQARNLRNASAARKIGALRESVIAALETSASHARQHPEAISAERVDRVEAQIRQIGGEIGELGTVLDHAFYEMAERPEQILQQLVETATERIYAGQSHSITAHDLSEWAVNAVQTRVDSRITRTRLIIEHAIEGLQKAGAELASSDVPSMEEAETLLRDVPRFELGTLTGEIRASQWKWLGRRATRVFVLKQLRAQFAALLKDELHRYGQALRLWSEQMTRRLTAFTNSYAEAYRAQLSRARGVSGDSGSVAELERDLESLQHKATAEVRNEIHQKA